MSLRQLVSSFRCLNISHTRNSISSVHKTLNSSSLSFYRSASQFSKSLPLPIQEYGLHRPTIEYSKVEVDSVPQKTFDPYRSKRCGVVAKKKGMTCLWDESGKQIPCTVLQIEDCQVTHIKTPEKDGYLALQVGAINLIQKKVTKPLLGHFMANQVNPKHRLTEFQVTEDAIIPVGTTLSAAHFVPGQFVDARAPCKGKGFQGGMKRHGFRGLRASHGVSLTHRSIGSTGHRAQPGKVFKGKKMPGRMGGQNVTVQNAQVVKIDVELNLVYLKGCVPGHNEQYVTLTDAIKKPGLAKFGAPWVEAFHPPTPEAYQPPFPTLDPAQLPGLPREIKASLQPLVDTTANDKKK